MYLPLHLLLFTTSLIPLTNALPATTPKTPTLFSLNLATLPNLTFTTRELANIKVTKHNAYVKFTTFRDETFASEEASKVLRDAKERMIQGNAGYGEKTEWKDAKFGEGHFWLWFTSFPPVAPNGLSGAVILEIIERMSAQTDRLWAWNFYVANFDVFEGSDAKGTLLEHGTIARDKPKGWLPNVRQA